MYACVCNRISVRQLAEAWAETQPDMDRLAEVLELYSDRCCGRCVEELDYLIDDAERSVVPAVRAG